VIAGLVLIPSCSFRPCGLAPQVLGKALRRVPTPVEQLVGKSES
jgi:hypothetical protein